MLISPERITCVMRMMIQRDMCAVIIIKMMRARDLRRRQHQIEEKRKKNEPKSNLVASKPHQAVDCTSMHERACTNGGGGFCAEIIKNICTCPPYKARGSP